jgi:predicted O-linked N-acetylglucosamine transferase (SPINDLY family)
VPGIDTADGVADMDGGSVGVALATREISAPDIGGWLEALLAATAAGAMPAERAMDIRARLRGVAFDAVIAAIERVGPAAAGAAEIRLYQDWIAANTGVSSHVFAAWFNLGVVLSRESDRANAVVAYRNALALRPDFSAAAINLGLAQEALGEDETALATWRQALQPDDIRTTLLNHRARVLEKRGRLDESENLLRGSLAIDGAQPDVVQHFLHVRQKMCRWPVVPGDVPGLSQAALRAQSGPLGILALTDDVAEQRAVAASWIARKTVAVPARLSPPSGYRHERIRVGYLSSDFCRHAMSYLIAELFERHDRARFEVFGYCMSPDDGSEIRARVLAAFDHVRIIRTLPDAAAARVIRDDEIDVLVDLNGLTAGARLQILRHRPAPIQATYLGFIGPVPLPELDFLFADDFVIPPDQAGAYLPRPLAIAPLYQANDSKRAIARAQTRAEAGLAEDAFVLCCFSNHYKVTPEMFAAWMAILRGAGRAVLWLAADNVWSHANLRAAAVAAGVDPARILIADRTGPDVYMARLGLADLFLDTFPYNAGTIASDALRMGVPLVTRAGQAFASRMAARLLEAIGAREGIAQTSDEYVAYAISLATDPAAHAAAKARFTESAWQASIGDIGAFTRGYESTLQRLVRQLPMQ